MYYRWSSAFLDAGKNGLTRETLRDATTEEVRGWKEENASLKKALADTCDFTVSESTVYRIGLEPELPVGLDDVDHPEERAKILNVALL
jgi:transposase